MRKVREDPDDNRRRAVAQIEIRQGRDRAPGRRGDAVSAALEAGRRHAPAENNDVSVAITSTRGGGGAALRQPV